VVLLAAVVFSLKPLCLFLADRGNDAAYATGFVSVWKVAVSLLNAYTGRSGGHLLRIIWGVRICPRKKYLPTGVNFISTLRVQNQNRY